MATRRDLTGELQRYRQAQALLQLGLRVPVACEMTGLSHWFLRKLAVELSGEAPCKGQVPNSELWYLRGRNNLHSSLFLSLHGRLQRAAGPGGDPADVLVAAFRQYRALVAVAGLPEVLSPDRAWWLLKSLKVPMLKRVTCISCGGRYLRHQADLGEGWACACCTGRLAQGPARQATGAQATTAQVTTAQAAGAQGKRCRSAEGKPPASARAAGPSSLMAPAALAAPPGAAARTAAGTWSGLLA